MKPCHGSRWVTFGPKMQPQTIKKALDQGGQRIAGSHLHGRQPWTQVAVDTDTEGYTQVWIGLIVDEEE